ncbi:unnamed protein product, partial [marine sediment metagenome]
WFWEQDIYPFLMSAIVAWLKPVFIPACRSDKLSFWHLSSNH